MPRQVTLPKRTLLSLLSTTFIREFRFTKNRDARNQKYLEIAFERTFQS